MRVSSTSPHRSQGSSPTPPLGSFSAPHSEVDWEFGHGAGVLCWCQGRAQQHREQEWPGWFWQHEPGHGASVPGSATTRHSTRNKFISSSRGLPVTPLLLRGDLNYFGSCNIWGCCTQNLSSSRTTIHLPPKRPPTFVTAVACLEFLSPAQHGTRHWTPAGGVGVVAAHREQSITSARRAVWPHQPALEKQHVAPCRSDRFVGL